MGKLTVDRTNDYELVKQIVTHPAIYPWISDDGSPTPDEWEPVQSDSAWYILVKDDGYPAGVYTFLPQNHICYEMHTCLLPTLWGNGSVTAGRMVIAWMFDHSPAQRIVGNAADYNRLAYRYGIRIGLKEYGLNPRSFLHDGVLYDQHELGISKEEVCR